MRLIPAWAGKTPTCFIARAWRAAHPRVGGENHAANPKTPCGGGSSPRGRGKQTEVIVMTNEMGLIPAWAGKTYFLIALPRRAWAHPRVGGENPVAGELRGVPCGSSPRGRGKRCASHSERQVIRLIPAWAGKTVSRPSGISLSEAHPRVGGENKHPTALGMRSRGSSPRGRGKRP